MPNIAVKALYLTYLKNEKTRRKVTLGGMKSD